MGPQPLHTGFLGCNQGENHLQEPPSWYYPQQGRSPSTGAAPGVPAALQGKSIFRQKGKCLYCIPAPPLPSLRAPRWSSWSGAACAAPREDSLLGANGNNLQRTAQPHVMLKGHSAERNASPTRAGLALQQGEGAQGPPGSLPRILLPPQDWGRFFAGQPRDSTQDPAELHRAGGGSLVGLLLQGAMLMGQMPPGRLSLMALGSFFPGTSGCSPERVEECGHNPA